mgnify:CR=1 FL=1
MQPARDQRDPRQHLGQLLLADLQAIFLQSGTITYYHPVTGEPKQYQMPAGGRGYIRPASLVSFVVHGALPAEQQRRPPQPGWGRSELCGEMGAQSEPDRRAAHEGVPGL